MTDVSVTLRPPCLCPSEGPPCLCLSEGHKHGVSIQSSINLGDTLLQITREWKIAETWFLARLFIYQSSNVSKILDFIHWIFAILVLITWLVKTESIFYINIMIRMCYETLSWDGERTSILPKAWEILVFKAPRHHKSPCCTRLSLHITKHGKSISSSIINLIVATLVGAIPQMIDAGSRFVFCPVFWTQTSLHNKKT